MREADTICDTSTDGRDAATLDRIHDWEKSLLVHRVWYNEAAHFLIVSYIAEFGSLGIIPVPTPRNPFAGTTKPHCQPFQKSPVPAHVAGSRPTPAAFRKLECRGGGLRPPFCTFLRQSILNGSRALDFKRRYRHYFAVPSHRGPPGGARARAAAGRAHALPWRVRLPRPSSSSCAGWAAP
eukprot:COSAG02_NODE_13441_length_1394_cov_32.749807_1_plen_181_part_00